ncbi:GntR family transcriptional regulator [Phenylobacterium sp.]|uniref:GntR family transcriptional regulator n=1 Tax=Phenylobacterium sp. TaxID=1871053 RepID=UPI002FE3DF93
MTAKRAEPFLVALGALRERLRQGAFDYERRLAATEIAEQLALSATPVREALARLAGEGLVEERRGQGYFVRRPGAVDVADLYRISQAYLLIALEPRGLQPETGRAGPEPDGAEASPEAAVARVEALFEAWLAAAGGWDLLDAHRRLAGRLGPVRRQEPRLIGDLAAEAAALARLGAGADRPALLAAVRAFHRRRIRLADRLAGLLERRPQAAPYRTDIG